ncbi:MAG: hypothetical protein WD426_16445 [Anditalea sp.]
MGNGPVNIVTVAKAYTVPDVLPYILIIPTLTHWQFMLMNKDIIKFEMNYPYSGWNRVLTYRIKGALLPSASAGGQQNNLTIEALATFDRPH